MKFVKSLGCACLLVLLIFSVDSCKRSQSSGWSPELLVPLVSTTLSLQNLVTDTNSLKTNADSSLTLAYTSSLYNFNLADQIVKIPDTSLGQAFNLDSLSLPTIHIIYTTTLLGLANQIGGIIQQIIIADQGQMDSVGPFVFPNGPPYSYDASALFDSAVLCQGQAQIWVVNGLPVNIAPGAVLLVKDSLTGHTLDSTVIGEIPAGDSVYLQLPLTPGRIGSHMLFYVDNIMTEHSNGKILINGSDAITLRVTVGNLHVCEAWAKFPNQTVLNQTADVTFDQGARKFTYIDARTGNLEVQIYNSVPQPLFLQYSLVGAYDKLGHPLNLFTTVPPAVNGHPGFIDSTLDITGYSINLTGQNGSAFNTYTQRVICALDSTGQTQHITLQDSLNVRYTLKNIRPNYIKGYMGRDTVSAVDSAAFNFLNIFKSGTISLQNVNMNFSVVNDIGVDGNITINYLKAVNANGTSQTLNCTPIINKPLYIKRATDFPLTPAVSNFSINSNNSNIAPILSSLPNQLQYSIQVQTNPHGNINQYRDFAYLQSGLAVNLNAEIPLSLVANSLVLKDTIAFNLANTNTNINGVNDGILNIIAENMYPIRSILTLIVYDANWNAVDTLALNTTVAAGNTDANCRVDKPTQTVLKEYVSNARINKLKQGTRAVVTSDFSTVAGNASCNGQHLKIYSNYTVGITISAKFNYKVTTKL